MPNCETCLYWNKNRSTPICQRDPHYEIRHSEDWCGEYQAKPIVQPIVAPPIIEPVIEIEPDKKRKGKK
jgi:hypothetical protein